MKFVGHRFGFAAAAAFFALAEKGDERSNSPQQTCALTDDGKKRIERVAPL
jgi:hypothetical protein